MGTEQIIARASELLWTGALAATPVGAAVAIICRLRRLRPSTRHLLWIAALASFLTPAVGSLLWKPHWFRSDRVIAAADSVLPPAPQHVESAGDAHPAAPSPRRPHLHQLVPPAPATRDLFAWNSRLAPTTTPSVEAWFDRPVQPAVAHENPVPAFPTPTDTAKATSFVGPLPEDLPSVVAPRSAPSLATISDNPPQPLIAPRDALALTPAPATSSAAPRPSPASPVRTWLLRVLAVRDSIADLPPVPLPVWFGGALFIVLLSIWRRCLAMLWLRGATPASVHVQALVRQVGETLGMAHTPRVVFVDAAVSPMIWCGLRPVLVLPTQLWRTLDEDSRRAVLVHELAHVRRWDHVMCWLVAAVSTVYWWHPLAWWARRRLHEEAEASCDAWVTDLFPSARRAYAAALVVTTSFVSSRAAKRGPWLGVASGSAKRLARRITMVMTHRAAPRVSILGVCFAAAVIGIGAFVMPALACPPDEDEVKAKEQAKAIKAARNKATTTVTAPTPPTTPAPQGGVQFFGEAPALEAMKGGQVAPAPPATPAPDAPLAPRPARAPKAPVSLYTVPAQPAVPAPPALAQPSQPFDLEALKVGRTPREYRLSPGKLEAFYGMMSRGDVPILVQLNDDHIIIWGTDDEHAVFGKFIKIVDADGNRASRGRIAVGLSPIARAEGQNLPEIAIARVPRDGEAQERAAVSEYRSSLNALMRDREAAQASIEKARADAESARAQAQELRSRNAQVYEEQRRAAEVAANSMRERSDTLQAASRDTEQRLKELERQLRQMEERARRLERQLEENAGRKDSKAKRTSTGPSTPIAERDLDDTANETEINGEATEAPATTVAPENR